MAWKMHFSPPLPINPKSVRGILTVSLLKRTCTRLCLGRRVVGGVVVTLLSNGHRLPLDGAQHLCLSGTFAPDKQGRSLTQHPRRRNRAPGITEVYLGEESSSLPSFFISGTQFCKDERCLRHPGVHLTRERIRGKMSSSLHVFSANYIVEVLHCCSP